MLVSKVIQNLQSHSYLNFILKFLHTEYDYKLANPYTNYILIRLL